MKEFRLHGPPGCGKSHALATRWVPAAAEKFGAQAVVICSLTKTAAQEIASRDLPTPKENVGTLHALAYRALGRPTIAEGEVDSWNERHPMFRLGGSAPSVENPEISRVDQFYPMIVTGHCGRQFLRGLLGSGNVADCDLLSLILCQL